MSIENSMNPALPRGVRGDAMLEPDEVMSMVRLHKSGWGAKRIAKEFKLRPQYGSPLPSGRRGYYVQWPPASFGAGRPG